MLFTGGMAGYLFGLLYWIADVRGYRAWCRPFVIYGRNAILVFVASGLLAKTLALVKVNGPEGVAVSLQGWLHRCCWLRGFRPIPRPWPTRWPTSSSGMPCCVSWPGARST